jgi:hypothetical protein
MLRRLNLVAHAAGGRWRASMPEHGTRRTVVVTQDTVPRNPVGDVVHQVARHAPQSSGVTRGISIRSGARVYADNVKVWTVDPVREFRRRITRSSNRAMPDARVRRRPEDEWKRSARNAKLGVWARLAIVSTLALAMLWWPYSRGCGLLLWVYLAATTMIVVGGIWVLACTWTCRMARTHGVALFVTLWGVGLVTLEVMQRSGPVRADARHPIGWSCSR